jgi:hypothetical protein
MSAVDAFVSELEEKLVIAEEAITATEQKSFESSENFEEEAGGSLERWSWRDQATLDPNLFEPVWINGEEFPGEMPEDLQEIVGDGRGKYF